MGNYKKFIFISNAGGTVDGTEYATEAEKAAYILSQAASGQKWFKSIIFRQATHELINRGVAYGLSVADAARITDLETAVAALQLAQLQVDSNDKILTITDGSGADAGKKFIGANVNIAFGDLVVDEGEETEHTIKAIKLIGKNSQLLGYVDATDFLIDGMLNDVELVTVQESGVTVEVPYLKFTFNTDAGQKIIRTSVKGLVDIYDGHNLVLSQSYTDIDYPTVDYDPTAIAIGASLDTVAAQLKAGIAKAMANAGVTSFGGQTGAITIKSGGTNDGDINFAMDTTGGKKELTATIYGLSNFAKKGDSLSAVATGGTNIGVTLGGTVSAPTLVVSESYATITKTATSAQGGATWAITSGDENKLIKASDLKNAVDYIEDVFGWEEL
jgi:hypothetical protein